MSAQNANNPAKKKNKKKQQKKQPIAPILVSSKLKESRPLIHNFHTLLKQMDAVKTDKTLSELERQSQLSKLEKQLEEMGGIKAYQDASIVGHTSNKYNTAKWVIKVLKQLSVFPPPKGRKLKGLDVGALTNHYLNYRSTIDMMSIDLNPRHSSVVQMDFFDVDYNTASDGFDIIVLSLVVNCVGDKQKRGDMILRSVHMLKPGGFLFIVLPLACLENSRYLSHDLFEEMLDSVDMQKRVHKDSKKLCFYMFSKRFTESDTHSSLALTASVSTSQSSTEGSAASNSGSNQSRKRPIVEHVKASKRQKRESESNENKSDDSDSDADSSSDENYSFEGADDEAEETVSEDNTLSSTNHPTITTARPKKQFPKRLLPERSGQNRNNFCIELL